MATDRSELTRIFTGKYDGSDGDWAGTSGPGSDPYYNIPYRAFLESFLRMNCIGSMVDIGCGDWQFSRYLDLGGIDYLGLDLVEQVVARNRERFGTPSIRFEVMPERLEDVPGAHLLVIKDVLQHLEITEVIRFRDIVFPKFDFCLVTNSFSKVAHDGTMMPVNIGIAPGDFRCLDPRAQPFGIAGAYVLRFNTGASEELRTLLVQR